MSTIFTSLCSCCHLTPSAPRAMFVIRGICFEMKSDRNHANSSFFSSIYCRFPRNSFSDDSSNVDFNRFMTWKKDHLMIMSRGLLMTVLKHIYRYLYPPRNQEPSSSCFEISFYLWLIIDVGFMVVLKKQSEFHMKSNQLRPSLVSRVQRKSLCTIIKVHNNCNLHSAWKETAKIYTILILL